MISQQHQMLLPFPSSPHRDQDKPQIPTPEASGPSSAIRCFNNAKACLKKPKYEQRLLGMAGCELV
jgi:hypothetical protein